MASFYASPLTTLVTVLAARNASSLHLPLCATNALNGGLWFAYGLVGGAGFHRTCFDIMSRQHLYLPNSMDYLPCAAALAAVVGIRQAAAHVYFAAHNAPAIDAYRLLESIRTSTSRC